MGSKTKKKELEYVIKEGKPTAVILDIDEYREMLERLDDVDDLQMLKQMRQKPLKFKKLESFLQEYQPNV